MPSIYSAAASPQSFIVVRSRTSFFALVDSAGSSSGLAAERVGKGCHNASSFLEKLAFLPVGGETHYTMTRPTQTYSVADEANVGAAVLLPSAALQPLATCFPYSSFAGRRAALMQRDLRCAAMAWRLRSLFHAVAHGRARRRTLFGRCNCCARGNVSTWCC